MCSTHSELLESIILFHFGFHLMKWQIIEYDAQELFGTVYFNYLFTRTVYYTSRNIVMIIKQFRRERIIKEEDEQI